MRKKLIPSNNPYKIEDWECMKKGYKLNTYIYIYVRTKVLRAISHACKSQACYKAQND